MSNSCEVDPMNIDARAAGVNENLRLNNRFVSKMAGFG
jgi:hypothetical protein